MYLNIFLKKFYLFMIVTHTHTERERERERGRDTGRGRSRLHAPGARGGIRSRVSRIVPWAKGRRQTAAPPRDPRSIVSSRNIYTWLVEGLASMLTAAD